MEVTKLEVPLPAVTVVHQDETSSSATPGSTYSGLQLAAINTSVDTRGHCPVYLVQHRKLGKSM